MAPVTPPKRPRKCVLCHTVHFVACHGLCVHQAVGGNEIHFTKCQRGGRVGDFHAEQEVTAGQGIVRSQPTGGFPNGVSRRASPREFACVKCPSEFLIPPVDALGVLLSTL